MDLCRSMLDSGKEPWCSLGLSLRAPLDRVLGLWEVRGLVFCFSQLLREGWERD